MLAGPPLRPRLPFWDIPRLRKVIWPLNSRAKRKEKEQSIPLDSAITSRECVLGTQSPWPLQVAGRCRLPSLWLLGVCSSCSRRVHSSAMPSSLQPRSPAALQEQMPNSNLSAIPHAGTLLRLPGHPAPFTPLEAF